MTQPNVERESVRARLLAGYAQTIALASLAAACLIVLGWCLHAGWLTGAIYGYTSVKANTAICLALIAAAIFAISSEPAGVGRRRAAAVLASIAALIAIATIAEYALGLRLGIDSALFADLSGGAFPGRMGVYTAVSILLLGVATGLIASGGERRTTIGHLSATLSATLAFRGLVGYIYGAASFYQFRTTTAMAPLTAVLILALSGALLWASRNRGFMRVINSDNAAGFLIRRILPPVIVVPVILGWLRIQGEQRGYFDEVTGISLHVTANVLVLGVLIAVNSRMLFRSESAREELQERLRANIADVERQIARRTIELRETAARLTESEQRFALAVDAADSGILDVDLAAGTLFCSPRWKSMLGLAGDCVGTPSAFLELVHPADRDRAVELLLDHYKGASSTFSAEVRMRHADGTYRWMLSRGQAVRDASGKAVRMVGSQTDITELKALQERLRTESIHDSLTGLYNRRYFEERISSAVNAAMRHGRPLSVCICDIDSFKSINDSFGHPTGDRVLQSFADILRRETRAEDIVARYGGDEFCVLFPDVDADDAASSCERIRQRLSTQHFSADDGVGFSVTASFGLARAESNDAAAFIGAADRALYDAKARGRNRLASSPAAS